jgi:hypothetical protein
VAVAPKTISGAPVSIAGEAFMTLPPIVPTLRVAWEPTIAEASASAVHVLRTAALAVISACVTSAPSVRSPEASMPRSASMR